MESVDCHPYAVHVESVDCHPYAAECAHMSYLKFQRLGGCHLYVQYTPTPKSGLLSLTANFYLPSIKVLTCGIGIIGY